MAGWGVGGLGGLGLVERVAVDHRPPWSLPRKQVCTQGSNRNPPLIRLCYRLQVVSTKALNKQW